VIPKTCPWPLCGREAELAYIATSIARGASAGVVLVGDAGVGKTRLAVEALRQAEARGYATEWVVATRAAASIPFGPFAPLLPEAPGATSNLLDLLCRLADALSSGLRGRRLVVGVDDAHLLDDASATLVHQLAVRRDAIVLAIVRAGEDVPDPIVALWKDELAARLELHALSEGQVGDLVGSVLGGQVDRPTVARLWEASQGNVVFLRQILLAGQEGGALSEAGGVWSWQGPILVSLRLQEAVAARLGTLDPDQAALMEVLAFSEPAPASLLERLFSPSTLERSERRGMTVVEKAGRRVLVRLAHPLYGEVARARCPVLRERAIRRELAAGLEATGARRLLEDCEGARTPALAGLIPELLTPREREVAVLAAQGLSSPEIARRLVVSTRTVQNQLQRGYVKLGVVNRAELRLVLPPVEIL
jgi:DNA-binding CsgD family transcriptional regulator